MSGDPIAAMLHRSLDAPVAQAISLGSARVLCAPALRDIIAERVAQVDVHGYTPDRDRGYGPLTLPLAASCHLELAMEQLRCGTTPPRLANAPYGWPWREDAWKPAADARASLVKAIALAWAALDRLDNAPRDAGDVE